MTEPVPINPKPDAPAQCVCIIDPRVDPWEVLVDEREAGETFSARSWAERSGDYATHDRIVVGLGGAPQFHPAAVTPHVLNTWIHISARDEGEARKLRSTLEMLLVQAWVLGWRDSYASTRIPDPALKPGWADLDEARADDEDGDQDDVDALAPQSPVTADQAMDVMEDVFGPRNGWSVTTQGLVERGWYQGLDPKTQSAFILRCKNIAVAFDQDRARGPRAIQPEEIVAWINQQSKNDNVAAGYYVAFSRLLGSIDKADWRLKVLSPSFSQLWSDCEDTTGDNGEPA